MGRLFAWLMLVWLLSASARSAIPSLTEIQARGSNLEIAGTHLEEVTTLWLASSAKPLPLSPENVQSQNSTQLVVRFPANTFRAEHLDALLAISKSGFSEFKPFLVSTLPVIPASATNASLAQAQSISLSSRLSGSVKKEESSWFRFKATRGSTTTFLTVAGLLGSELDPVLRVHDAKQRELAYNDDGSAASPDSALTFQAPATQDYYLQLRDINYTGGAGHRYELLSLAGAPSLPTWPESLLMKAPLGDAVTEAEPNDTTNQAQEITLPSTVRGSFSRTKDRDVYRFTLHKGESWNVQGITRGLNSEADIYFSLLDAGGREIAKANLTGAEGGVLTNQCKVDGTYFLQVEELNQRGGSNYSYALVIERGKPGFVLTAKKGLLTCRVGTNTTLALSATRTKYDGSIMLESVGLESLVSLQNNVFTNGATNLTVTVTPKLGLMPGTLIPLTLSGRPGGTNDVASAFVETRAVWKDAFPLLVQWPDLTSGQILLLITE